MISGIKSKIQPLLNDFKRQIDSRYNSWIRRRIPSETEIELNQRKLFIFPSKEGLVFLMVFILVLVCAINYQNNLIYAMAFFLASLFNSAILFTFYNLSGLKLKIKQSHNNFVGEHIAFDIELMSSNNKKAHHSLKLHFKDQRTTEAPIVISDTSMVTRVYSSAKQRGYFEASRLCVESSYPLGIIRCWTWVDLTQYALVYPKPIQTSPESWLTDSDEGEIHSQFHGDDFHGFKNYEAGDSLTHAYWPSLARGQRLQNKSFNSFVADDHWLDYDQIHRGNIEETLSKLCFLALELEKKGESYGLRLPGKSLAINSGQQHLHDVLSDLAVYGLPKHEF